MKALIAMSGGVDSSVAAYLTKKDGLDCTGCTMRLYENEDAGVPVSNTCCSLEDVEDARSVAFKLGMPYYVFNFSDDFKDKVINKFVESYECGITPNPCIDCNRYMKFDKLFLRAKVLGCDYVVTGHYACIEKDGDRFLLKKAVDSTKDQSYVLYSMTQEQLAHTLFPLGTLKKTEVRKLAEQNGFINAKKPESQDICFVPDGDYAKVIAHHISEREGISFEESSFECKSSSKNDSFKSSCDNAVLSNDEAINNDNKNILPASLCPGNFISTNGDILGQHKGIIHYTIGQRKGLGISAKEPLYVCNIDVKNNIVILGSNDELFSDTLYVKEMNWISGTVPEGDFRCNVKIRYKHTEQPATVYVLSSGTESGAEIKIVFDEPQRAITPGQAAVLYDGDTVLGGGVII